MSASAEAGKGVSHMQRERGRGGAGGTRAGRARKRARRRTGSDHRGDHRRPGGADDGGPVDDLLLHLVEQAAERLRLERRPRVHAHATDTHLLCARTLRQESKPGRSQKRRDLRNGADRTREALQAGHGHLCVQSPASRALSSRSGARPRGESGPFYV